MNMIDAPCTEFECFAYKNGYCAVLVCSNFGKRKCPFFKTKEQFDLGQALSEKRRNLTKRGD